ncbi:energy-coupling factor transporter ATPase [Staphylococcus muscae]|uniref:ABC transporter ATP-binding protein n=1 Tax=Staphylococcus muscae TaxID=1294 RepID=A0A240C972_9STAP|nr:energy-coupling factor transporter ATPase [Staphylococcus muscae]AVQ33611.1 energy-coupling factor transporter ATPase [Staphylococcus muscae]PNZ06459.1 energy-coupling factor transporter ATPase [Staphylococcus muscae]GGA86248.1 energy-coupling factor transporter ATP-binding protein EcfA1 [Staphylococcus muscae]SNW03628.1 ABC transporter ATP-binding protein [Staphylococcus muscae]
MSTEPLLKIQNVSFRYDEETEHILKNISFTVKEGEWVSIVGHNGSGKSTLAKLIAGVENTFDGDIKIENQTIKSTSLSAFHHHIGFVFQNPDNQFVGSTVKYDVAFGLENRQVSYEKMHQIVSRVLKDVDMKDKKNYEPTALSGGQKQRVAIAGVLALQPKLIILDEATSMLDPEGKKDIMSMIQYLNQEQGMTVLSITHDLSEVVTSDKVIVLNKGSVALSGTVDDIFAHADTLVAYGLDMPFEMRVAQLLDLQKGFLTYDELLECLT